MQKKPRRVNLACQYFGKQVRFFRNEQEITLRQLVKKSGVNYVSLIDIEHGRVEPTFVTALKIAEALRLDLNQFRKSV